MQCPNQTGIWQGCRGFCLGQEVLLEDLFETCTAPLSTYHMCAFHADVLKQHVPQDYSPALLSMAIYLQDDKKFAPELFPVYTVAMGLNAADTSRLLLSPEFFWLLNPNVVCFIILCGALPNITNHPEQVPRDFSYVYILDLLCEIMGWIIDGNEDVNAMGITKEHMSVIKWSKLSQCVAYAFNMVMLTTRMFPSFDVNWEDKWRARMDHWLQVIWIDSFSQDQLLFIGELLDGLIEILRIPAEHSQQEPLPLETTMEIMNQSQQQIEHERLAE